jgi:hypothetical protein
MSMLVFFPWLKMSGQGEIVNFRLMEYKRRELPAGSGTPLQQEIDSILESYRAHGQQPIDRATILVVGESGLTRELAEEEINAVFAFAELVAFAGLATRQFFSHFEYSNRDLFQVVVQRYSEAKGGATFTYRRRDGFVTNYVTRDALAIQRPGHIVVPMKATVDIPLLNAFVQAREQFDQESWNAYFEAIVNYGIANRDSPDLTLHTEAVLMSGAFERLFNLRSGKENELAESFTAALQPAEEIPAETCARFSDPEAEPFLRKHYPVRNAWIRDFFRFRGNLAHGQIAPGYRSRWSLQEHLLLASYIFPLLVKCKLSRDGLYTLTDRDQADIDVFEKLACVELFPKASTDPIDEEAENVKFPWNEVRGSFLFKRMFTRASSREQEKMTVTEKDPKVD